MKSAKISIREDALKRIGLTLFIIYPTNEQPTTETLKPHLAHGEHLLDYFSEDFTGFALRHYPKIAVGLTETRVLLVPF